MEFLICRFSRAAQNASICVTLVIFLSSVNRNTVVVIPDCFDFCSFKTARRKKWVSQDSTLSNTYTSSTKRDRKAKNAGHGWFSSWMVTIFPSMILLIINIISLSLSVLSLPRYVVHATCVGNALHLLRCVALRHVVASRLRVASYAIIVVRPSAPRRRAASLCRCCRAAVASCHRIIEPHRCIVALLHRCRHAALSPHRATSSRRRVVAPHCRAASLCHRHCAA